MQAAFGSRIEVDVRPDVNERQIANELYVGTDFAIERRADGVGDVQAAAKYQAAGRRSAEQCFEAFTEVAEARITGNGRSGAGRVHRSLHVQCTDTGREAQLKAVVRPRFGKSRARDEHRRQEDGEQPVADRTRARA